ncbi:nucleotide exchange factor GrpE [Streptomyces sp. NPDC050585]|uniref:nucleotide exchange factor GrpE n=1 Tax=Streptomyces sp. NPDC050585 TaxID=3365632 RepID=UPI00378C3266
MRRDRFRVESRPDRRLMLAPPPSDRTSPARPSLSPAPSGPPRPDGGGAEHGGTAPSAAGHADRAPRRPDASGPRGGGAGVAAVAAALAERTRDLQRLKAEYDNYRGRVHRDRLAVREVAVANVLARLLPVLDAVAEAARHGELTGGFLRVARQLEDETAALGLVAFGTPGEPFDPRVHEAVAYRVVDGVERPVCAEVVRSGYRVGGQLLRPADVLVAGPPAAR